MDFIIYQFQVAICWAIFLGSYYFIFSKTTFFGINRWYLMGTVIMGILLPLLPDVFAPPAIQRLSLPMVAQVMGGDLTAFSPSLPTRDTSFRGAQLIGVIYTIGALVLVWKFTVALLAIRNTLRKGEVVEIEGVEVLKSPKVAQPYSFFRTIFWPLNMAFTKREQRMVLKHELAHVKGGHSWDIVLIELFKVVFWLNPFVHWYAKLIKLNHEFLADAAVIKSVVKQQYGHFLLKQSIGRTTASLGHSIFHSPIKNRIKMITKTPSYRMQLGMYALNIPIILLLMIGLSDGLQQPLKIGEMIKTDLEILNASDISEPPVFPGCETLPTEAERQACSQEKMMEYIFKNINYPVSARAKNQMGTVVFSLIIGRDGKTQEVKLDKSVVEELDQALNEVLMNMPQWVVVGDKEPLESHRVRVPIRFLIEGGDHQIFETEEEQAIKETFGNHLGVVVGYPSEKSTPVEGGVKISNLEGADLVKFEDKQEPLYIVDGQEVKANSLEFLDADVIESVHVLKGASAIEKYGDKGENGVIEITLQKKPLEPKDALKVQPKQEIIEVFKVVEKMPLFAGAQNQEESNQKLAAYIGSNLEYPESEKEKGAEGTVVVRFVVNQEGGVTQIEVLKSFSDACSDAVVRMIENMNNLPEKWSPGVQRGRTVRVQLALPVNFKLP